MADNLPESQPPTGPGPAHGPRDRRPLPLLSRAKLRPPRELRTSDDAAIPTPPPAARPRRKRSLPARIGGVAVGAALLVGLGVEAVRFLRQTQVQGLLVAPGATLPGEVYLVRDFSDDIRTLRTEFKLANEPYERDARQKAETLQRVASDLARLEQHKKLIADGIGAKQEEIRLLLVDARRDAQKVWENDGNALDQDYAKRLNGFRQALADRAKQLGLAVTLDPQAGSPEVWANGFRLALYDPPASVKPIPERAWLEKQLADWHAYEKDTDTQRAGLKDKAEAIRKRVAPHVDEINAAIAKANTEIDEAENTAAPLRSEREVLQAEAESAQERAAVQRKSYAEQLVQLPKQHILDKFPLDAQGRFHWENLQASDKYKPGNYLLWASLQRDGAEYWALVPFPVKEYTRVDLVVDGKAFVPAAGLLK
jgi:hypothetical protein